MSCDQWEYVYSQTCVKQPLSKRPKIIFQDQLFKLPFVIKILVLSIFEWPFYTGFTVKTNTFDLH